MCGGDFFISVAEIRYRHDHKFHFCPFEMKISRIDEEKELYCVSYPGLCLGFLFWGLGGVDSKKFLEPRRSEKKFFRARRGPGACSPENFER